MSDIKVGKLIDEHQKRDAIHVAIAPVVAAHNLVPGQRVGVWPYDTKRIGTVPDEKVIGVVDPFLDRMVKAGESFWMFMLPGSTTPVRHEWSHPALHDAPAAKFVEVAKNPESIPVDDDDDENDECHGCS